MGVRSLLRGASSSMQPLPLEASQRVSVNKAKVMLTKWFPWKYVVRRVARARGFVDPISVLSRLHSFAEPSVVTAPSELLRAGVVFHARGLMNAGSIQHNRDWIWPFWVERQYDPRDEAFLPRAFSITHVNLTHRDWTAVGIPGGDHLPIVDPRGLLTPHWDSWSIDGWIFESDGGRLIPSRERAVRQELHLDDGLAVETHCSHATMDLHSQVEVQRDERGDDWIHQTWRAESEQPAWLLLSIRPYNPEGVSFVHDIELDNDHRGWSIGQHGRVLFSEPADQHFTSDYKHGDVSAFVWTEGANSVHCPVGMATAAAAFQLEPGTPRELKLRVPLDERQHHHWLRRPPTKPNAVNMVPETHTSASQAWHKELSGATRLDVPDDRFQFLHEAALRSLILHCPGPVYPGPYTYKRFWMRDAAFILNAALTMGLQYRVDTAMPRILQWQDRDGYFHSQPGEWDANGEALWLMERYARVCNQPLPSDWIQVARKAADWIRRKRITTKKQAPVAGLLPAGFSAEHLGPSDYYYWDDFWSVAGLRTARRMMLQANQAAEAARFEHTANELEAAIEQSLRTTDHLRDTFAYPAAPERRMDSGAVGSLVASCPLQLVEPNDARLLGTVDYLLEHCMVEGGFFQDMIHSGINAHLTLHLAQVMLRNHDPRAFELINSVAKLASPTGQWPEAIHPRTFGGCMGDGQHIWAAAEWLMAIRNMFVREEHDSLLIGSGIPAHWHYDQEQLQYGPTQTPWGSLSLTFQFSTEAATVQWHADWHADAPPARVAIPCFQSSNIDLTSAQGQLTVPANHTCHVGALS